MINSSLKLKLNKQRKRRNWTYLWYCSLEHKVRHVSLSGVRGMDGDNCNIGIGVGPLKCELYFQAIFVVRRHWWNACEETNIIMELFHFTKLPRQQPLTYKHMSSPAAMSLKRGCEVKPSKRKGGWDTGKEGAGVGVGAPTEWEENEEFNLLLIEICEDKPMTFSFPANIKRNVYVYLL